MKKASTTASSSSNTKTKESGGGAPNEINVHKLEFAHERRQQSLFDAITKRSGSDTRNILLISVLVVCLEIYILAYVLHLRMSHSTTLYFVLFGATFFLLRDIYGEFYVRRYCDSFESLQVSFTHATSGQTHQNSYVRLNPDHLSNDLSHLQLSQDTILGNTLELTLEIRYPLLRPLSVQLTSEKDNQGKKNWSRLDLAQLIAQRYAQVYNEEQTNSKLNPNQFAIGAINYLNTTGEHGIWGWALGNLRLTGFVVKRQKSGVTVIPTVESFGKGSAFQ